MSYTTRANMLPMTANCSRCGGRHSTLAPTSSSSAGRPRVGITAASAGRSTPGNIPNALCAAITVAPVCPALKSADASPLTTASAATLIDAPGLRRSAADGDSSIPTTSGASTMRTRSRSMSRVSRVLVELGLDRVAVPDKQDAEIEMTYGRQRPVHDIARRLVAAHCVDCDPDHSEVPGSGFRVQGSGSRFKNRELWNLERGTSNL